MRFDCTHPITYFCSPSVNEPRYKPKTREVKVTRSRDRDLKRGRFSNAFRNGINAAAPTTRNNKHRRKKKAFRRLLLHCENHQLRINILYGQVVAVESIPNVRFCKHYYYFLHAPFFPLNSVQIRLIFHTLDN